jgi:hypothetical protein
MEKLSKLKLCLMVLPFVFLLNLSGAVGQEKQCIFQTMPENVEGIEYLLALQWAPGHPPAEIEPGKNAVVKVVGGFPPIQWSVSGNGFSLDKVEEKDVDHARNKLLKASSAACGPATITVTDALEETKTGYVRCTNGVWVFKGYYCGMGSEGEATMTGLGGGYYSFTLTKGYQRQSHWSNVTATHNYVPCADRNCLGYCSGIGCEPCLDWSDAYNCHLVPCIDTPTETLPNRSSCFRNLNFDYWEWECP